MVEYFIIFALAFIVAFSATPIAKKLALKAGALDVPSDERRMHRHPIARFGGLAIVSGFLVSILFNVIGAFIGVSGTYMPDLQLIGLIAGIVVIEIAGVIDDIWQVKARIKLAFQVAAAIIVVLSGTKIEILTNPFSSTHIATLNLYISYIITVIWIVGITNAVNLIDGLDGLAAGVASIASLSLFFVSVIYSRWDMAIITAALAGGALGFLPYNFNPAKIFMGETGSAFLGFTLAVVAVQGTLKAYAAIAIAAPILILGLPLFDTIFAIGRRIAKGKSIMEADRGHLHHRLIDMGLSQKQSVAIMYAVSAVLGLCAIVLADKGALSAIILIIILSAFVVGGARYMSEINSNGSSDHESKNGKDGETPSKNDSKIDTLTVEGSKDQTKDTVAKADVNIKDVKEAKN
ncbi:MAG: MraY family glycosyltransferase [Bacillota bacterium]|nr:MraY family glycosyltransferase [Bacillota bacterium]